MPVTFLLLALAMSVIAALFIMLPARKASRSTQQSWVLATGVFATVVVAGTAAFYNTTSKWNWAPNGVPDAPIAKQLYELQRAVHDDENNAVAWAELGRFYLGFNQVSRAIDALEKSVRLSRGRDVETNLNLVEALALRREPNDASRSEEILSASLRVDPEHKKALWYGGEVAAGLGQWDVAVARWQAMLNMARQLDSEEARSVTSLLEGRIASARSEQEKLDGMAHISEPGSAPEAVRISVSLDSKLAQTPLLTPSTNLFVFVRPRGQGGPPLAVHRATVGQLPLDITLSDVDAMMPSRTLSAFDELEIVARVALGGKPTLTPGDLFGRQELNAGDDRRVSITINQVAAVP